MNDSSDKPVEKQMEKKAYEKPAIDEATEMPIGMANGFTAVAALYG